jgi:hypothetical protein
VCTYIIVNILRYITGYVIEIGPLLVIYLKRFSQNTVYQKYENYKIAKRVYTNGVHIKHIKHEYIEWYLGGVFMSCVNLRIIHYEYM